MAKVVVTGGRDYDDFAMVSDVLDSLKIDMLYVGDADGADKLAREWAAITNTNCKEFKADWIKYGKPAGPIRNGVMLDEAGPDAIVIAFLGGPGTRNCTNQALDRNMIVMRVEE